MSANQTEISPIMHVEMLDTTCRDAAQSLPPENKFPRDVGVKVEIAEALAGLGINTIEAGFPATDGDGEEVAEVATTVGQTEYSFAPKTIETGELITLPVRHFTPVVTGLTLAKPGDIEQTWQAVQGARNPGIHTFVATAEEHMRAKHAGMSKEQVLTMAQDGIRHAREVGGSHTRVEFSCEAASTTDMATLERFVKMALQEDIDVINLPDTLGAASPLRMAHIFAQATRWMIEAGRHQEVMISSHNHNDGERAVQNAISSMHAVIDTALGMEAAIPRFQFEGVMLPGGGERNGNAFLPPFVRDVLTDRHEFQSEVDIAVDTTGLKGTTEHVASQAGLAVDPNTPVVGIETAVTRSGVHSDAIVKGGAAVYAAVNPQWFGHPHAAIIGDSDYQGSAGRNNLGATDIYRSELVMRSVDINERIGAIGMRVDAEQLERITVRSNSIARRQKRPITDIEIEAFVAKETGETITDAFEIISFDEKTADNTAVVVLRTPEGENTGEATRVSGPIGALINAANRALDFDGDYGNWEAHALSATAAAVGAISLSVKQNGYEVSSVDEAVSVDEASLRAYIKGVSLIDRISKRQMLLAA